MSRGPDAATLLERALVFAARDARITLHVDAADWTRWASATFTGARHQLTLRAVDSPALTDWIAGLSEQTFHLPGHVVADLIVLGVEVVQPAQMIRVEALTVESV